MAWAAPITAVPQSVWTAAQWNSGVRDNLLETCPGKATTAGRWFVSSGLSPTTIAERQILNALTTNAGTTSSTSYTATLGGTPGTNPAVTITTGIEALVWFAASMSHTDSSASQRLSVAVSGATTIAADDDWAAQCDGVVASNTNRLGSMRHFGPGSGQLTAGSNTFTLQYATGAATATFSNREIIVMAM